MFERDMSRGQIREVENYRLTSNTGDLLIQQLDHAMSDVSPCQPNQVIHPDQSNI